MAYTIRPYDTKGGRRYEVRYRKPDGTATGKRGFKRKMDATDWGDQYVNAAKRDGSFVDQSAGRAMVSDIYREWMDTRRPILKANTLHTDDVTWRNHIEPEFADRQIGSITHRELQAFISGKAETLAPSTVLKMVGVLKGICDLAVKDRLIAKAPTDDLALPRREGRRLHRYLTIDQLLAVADEAGKARIQPEDRRALVLLLGLCGLRWGEMSGLKVEDVDYARNRIHVRRNVTRIGSKWEETSPKSHEMRDVPMPRTVGEALLPVLACKRPTDWVFRDHLGRPPRNQSATSADWNRTWFVSACRRAGVEPLPPHDLRHTAASIAVHAGANVKALQRMLGHKSAAMTLDTYADLFDSDLDDVARVIDAAVQVRSKGVGKMWARDNSERVRSV